MPNSMIIILCFMFIISILATVYMAMEMFKRLEPSIEAYKAKRAYRKSFNCKWKLVKLSSDELELLRLLSVNYNNDLETCDRLTNDFINHCYREKSRIRSNRPIQENAETEESPQENSES